MLQRRHWHLPMRVEPYFYMKSHIDFAFGSLRHSSTNADEVAVCGICKCSSMTFVSSA